MLSGSKADAPTLFTVRKIVLLDGVDHCYFMLAIDGDEEVQGLNFLGARGYADDVCMVWMYDVCCMFYVREFTGKFS